MNKEVNNLEKLSEPLIDDPQHRLDKLGRAYATGRRKTSVSRVWLKKGSGKIVVNGKPSNEYFTRNASDVPPSGRNGYCAAGAT